MARCALCVFVGPDRPTELLAQGDAVWHIYEDHPKEWVRLIGDRPPKDFDPRTIN
jgi:hypothetical protein